MCVEPLDLKGKREYPALYNIKNKVILEEIINHKLTIIPTVLSLINTSVWALDC